MTADELTTVDGRPALRMERRLAHRSRRCGGRSPSPSG